MTITYPQAEAIAFFCRIVIQGATQFEKMESGDIEAIGSFMGFEVADQRVRETQHELIIAARLLLKQLNEFYGDVWIWEGIN